MPRTTKTIKLEDGSESEVYTDNCNTCSVEMMFPKEEADRLEALFPFLKQKIEAGTPCFECARKKEESDPAFKMFNEQEIELVKNFITKGK